MAISRDLYDFIDRRELAKAHEALTRLQEQIPGDPELTGAAALIGRIEAIGR